MGSVVLGTIQDKVLLDEEIRSRFGLLPNFFCTSVAAPGLMNELWGFARSAYLDSPFPSLFKERLFVYLSRFCPIRYCVIRHVGFLIGKGHPSGDARATPQTIVQVLRLLKRPAPDVANMGAVYQRLNSFTLPVRIPAPETELEGDLFDALAIMFVEPRRAEKALLAIRQALGETTFELLTAYLAFIRTAHYWTETHPELVCEQDMLDVMDKHKELAVLLLDTEEAERIQSGDILRKALNESEEKYRAIFNSIDEAFALCEVIVNGEGKVIDYRFLEVNPSFEKVIGVKAEIAKDQTMGVLLPSMDDWWMQTFAKAALGRETIHFENRLAGLNRWFSVCASPIGEMSSGQFVLIFNDITGRKWLEQQKEDFLSIASHELKTPVTSIKAYGQLLQLGFEEMAEKGNALLAKKMNAQINRLNMLITDLLDTTKISEGQLILEHETFDVTELIRLIVEEYRQLSKKHNLIIACETIITVHADRKRIEQVITNLLSNAIKYSPDGGNVFIDCERLAAEIKITVTDNGIGIPKDDQERLFKRFSRLKKGRSNTLPGMGLGLYICAGIIHGHGGTIVAQSNPDGGSIFYFTVPCDR